MSLAEASRLVRRVSMRNSVIYAQLRAASMKNPQTNLGVDKWAVANVQLASFQLCLNGFFLKKKGKYKISILRPCQSTLRSPRVPEHALRWSRTPPPPLPCPHGITCTPPYKFVWEYDMSRKDTSTPCMQAYRPAAYTAPPTSNSPLRDLISSWPFSGRADQASQRG